MSVNVRAGDVDQLMMMPPSVREWLPEDHLAFFVLDVVAELDLSAFYAAYRVDGRGGSVYDPAMMLSVLLSRRRPPGIRRDPLWRTTLGCGASLLSVFQGARPETTFPGLSVARGWWLGLEGLVPPPVGAFAGRSGTRCDGGWGCGRGPGQRSRVEPIAGGVGDREPVGGAGDGDPTPMVQPMVVRTN